MKKKTTKGTLNKIKSEDKTLLEIKVENLEKRIEVLELLCDEHFNNKEPKVLGKELFDELYMPRTNVNRDGSLEELQEIKTYCRHTDYAVRGLYFDFNQIENDLKAFEIIKEQIKKNNCFVIIKEPELCSKEDSDLLKECLK